MASFAVEAFGLDRISNLTGAEIEQRYQAFVDLTRFQTLDGNNGLPLREK